MLQRMLLTSVGRRPLSTSVVAYNGHTATTTHGAGAVRHRTSVLKKNLLNHRLSLPAVCTTSVSKSTIDTSPPTENSFIQTRKHKQVKNHQTKTKTQGSRILLKNRFDVLAQESTEEHNSVEDSELSSTAGKVLLCTDSHGRDLSWHLNNIDNSSDYVGFVTPGGRAKQVLKMDNINGENLTEKNFLVIMCGTNDVARNEGGELINKMKDFMKNVKNKQVVLIDIPNRYDLADWSCVNLEIKKTNLALKSLTQQLDNVTLVEASKASRDMHTRQGLHFNSRGKSWLAKRIKEVVKGQYINSEKSVDVEDKQPPPPGTDRSGNELLSPQDRRLHQDMELFLPL